ncbi:4-hydroxy-tetrahydrodipicolinate synthase [Hazenella coriacea]|uniref:4-hydroxy-tetrahydrodipicolinate synthase n=1 Tax=Hazenella coriacea TaxID=1179467 RepID=A0A4R3L047_9BACL|nr:4-hydroxy-tetrahydrodipicolinate synthase [Hazenella coriacea]
MQFGRLVTAMITPFTKEHQIDWLSLEKVIEHLIETGTDAIVVSGTTAESPNLSKEEKLKLFQFTLNQVQGRVKVIAGTGSNNTEETIDFTKEAEKIGVDGVMLVVPYYNKPSQEGLYQHFAAIATSTSLPVMLYNVPGRTGVNMSVSTMVKLVSLKNVVAIKEASGDLTQISQLIASIPDDVAVYSGDDGITLPVMAVGGVGVVSVASHVIGKEMKKMIEAFFAGDHETATSIHQQFLPVFQGLFITSNPVPVKYALSKLNLCEPWVRLPLVEMDETEKLATDGWIELLKKTV